jgi:tetratricopeptide (TPR) repeat protein
LHHALELLERTSAEQAGSLLSVLVKAAAALYHSKQDEGRSLLTEADRIAGTAFGEDTLERAEHIAQFAEVARSAGDYRLARDWFERARSGVEAVLGATHPKALKARMALAETLIELGDLSTAKVELERLLETQQSVLGPEHPDTLASMAALAVALRRLGQHATARQLQEKVLEARRRLLGEADPNTLDTAASLALTLWDEGHGEDAQRSQELVLKARSGSLSEDNPELLNELNNLALTLRSQGDLPAARALLERAVDVGTRAKGLEHPHTLKARATWPGSCAVKAICPLRGRCSSGC